MSMNNETNEENTDESDTTTENMPVQNESYIDKENIQNQHINKTRKKYR